MATTYTWTGAAGDGDWFNPANWSSSDSSSFPGTVAVGDSAVVDNVSFSSLTVVNDGTIESNGASALIFQGNSAISGSGQLLAAGTGGITLASASVAGGSVAVNSGSSLNLNGNATIGGGSLDVAGALNVSSAGNSIDATVATAVVSGQISISNGATLDLATPGGATATIDNTGTIALNSTGSTTDLQIGSASGGTVDLSGGGSLTLSDNVANEITGYNSTVVLDNQNNTIVGAGLISGLTLSNEGTILAGGFSNTMTLDNVAASNSGTIKSRGGAGLIIDGASAITQTSSGLLNANGPGGIAISSASVTGGSIVVDTNSSLNLDGNAQIVGASLSLSGALNVKFGTNSIDATAATPYINGLLAISDGATLDLATAGGATATIGNYAEIALNSTGDATGLEIGSVNGATVNFLGYGTVVLSDNAANEIYSNYSNVTLVSANTIEGAGQIANLNLTNKGIIDANATVNALTLNGVAVANSGTVESTGGGNLAMTNASVTGGSVVVDSTSSLNLDGGGQILSASLNVTGALNVNGGSGLISADTIVQTGSGSNPGGIIEANALSSPVATSLQINSSSVTNGAIEASGSLVPSAPVDATVTIDNTTLNGVDIIAQGAALVDVHANATVQGSTSATIIDGGTISFETAFNGNAQFTGAGALNLAQDIYTGTVTNFQSGDTIALQAFGAGDKFSYVTSGDTATLSIANSTGALIDTITVNDTLGPYAATGAFTFAESGGVDTITGQQSLCFLAGTMIVTADGEAPVETLKRGDLVMTTSGVAMPVAWLGRQTVSARFADPARSWPIRVKAGALGANVPSRDLLLSPDHALLVDDVLIHAGALVNGASIVRETKVPSTFVYYHVELEDHSLILAENTPAETFIDNADRLAFDNWAEHEALYPNGKPIEEMPYPRAKARRQVPMRVRGALEERARLIGPEAISAVA